MDIKETAKSILQKGIELKDESLIKMGHELLERYSQENNEPPLKVDFATDLNPEGDIELKPTIKTKSFNYVCENCFKEFHFDKKRKKCPECNTSKLKIKEVINVEGESKKKYAKKQPLDLNKSKYNRFVDINTNLFNDSENEYLKQKPRVPRTRKPYQSRHVKCTVCGKEEDISPLLASRSEYMCNKCIMRAGRV